MGLEGGWRLVTATLNPLNYAMRPEVWANVSNMALGALVLGIVYSITPEGAIRRAASNPRVTFWGMLALFMLAVLKLNRDAESPFLYFQF